MGLPGASVVPAFAAHEAAASGPVGCVGTAVAVVAAVAAAAFLPEGPVVALPFEELRWSGQRDWEEKGESKED